MRGAGTGYRGSAMVADDTDNDADNFLVAW